MKLTIATFIEVLKTLDAHINITPLILINILKKVVQKEKDNQMFSELSALDKVSKEYCTPTSVKEGQKLPLLDKVKPDFTPVNLTYPKPREEHTDAFEGNAFCRKMQVYNTIKDSTLRFEAFQDIKKFIRTEFNKHIVFQPKYEIGENVFIMNNNAVIKIELTSIEVSILSNDRVTIKYSAKKTENGKTWLDFTDIQESDIYRTKTEILNNL